MGATIGWRELGRQRGHATLRAMLCPDRHPAPSAAARSVPCARAHPYVVQTLARDARVHKRCCRQRVWPLSRKGVTHTIEQALHAMPLQHLLQLLQQIHDVDRLAQQHLLAKVGVCSKVKRWGTLGRPQTLTAEERRQRPLQAAAADGAHCGGVPSEKKALGSDSNIARQSARRWAMAAAGIRESMAAAQGVARWGAAAVSGER